MVPALYSSRLAFPISVLAITLGLASCNTQPPSSTPQGGASSQTGGTSAAQPGAGGTVSLSGAGASFPDPLYQTWFSTYNKDNPNVQISYQSVGSGAGIKQFLAKTVDFGATDAPLKAEEISSYPSDRGKPIQVPMTGGPVVFSYNLQGVDNLKLSREAYCGIADGTIKSWNDPKITKDNSAANLPNTPISFVHRSDGSGTTSIFTNHLKAACPNWKAGAGKSIQWPVGTGAKGNEGVAAAVQQTQGAIGYNEYSYAKENKIQFATLQNKTGQFVTPSPESAAKAFEEVPVPENLVVSVPDPQGADAYPIVGLTYLLLYGQYDDPAKADALKNMVKWALTNGDQYAEQLGYIPLPDELQTKVLTTVDTVTAQK